MNWLKKSIRKEYTFEDYMKRLIERDEGTFSYECFGNSFGLTIPKAFNVLLTSFYNGKPQRHHITKKNNIYKFYIDGKPKCEVKILE